MRSSSASGGFLVRDEIAMSINWHDFMISFQNPERSKIVDKVYAAIMPTGLAGSRNYYSGAALAINSAPPIEYQKAAWLFLVWQASTPVQKQIFKQGSTPVRKSVYADPEVKGWIESGKYPGALIAPVMQEAWSDEHLEYVGGTCCTVRQDFSKSRTITLANKI